jgi:RimJ/RimL family protein N-acetyltransferase
VLVLVGILAVSTFVVGYLIWSSGGLVTQPEQVEIVHVIPGFTLRLPQLADVSAFLSIAGEPEAMKHLGWDAAMLASFGHEQRSLTLDALQTSTMVAEADSGEVAGFTAWGSQAGDPTQITIGLNVGHAYTGQGVGTGLMRAAILVVQGAERQAWVHTATTNLGMQKIMERLGFSPPPDVAEYVAPNGESFDSLWYKVGLGARAPR